MYSQQLSESELWLHLLLSGCMLVNNAGTLHQIDIETSSNILPYITFCIPVTI